MNTVKRKWDVLSRERRKACIAEIITFFKEERSEQIGIIAAGEILDFFLQTIGGDIYNKGVDDSKELLQKRMYDLEVDLDVLQST